jgi:hypothetical protein
MTAKQAREYATRIRLGEPLWWGEWRRREWALIMNDGTVIAKRMPLGRARAPETQGWQLTASPYTPKRAVTHARHDPAIPDNVEAILYLLDEKAKDPKPKRRASK